MLRVRYPLCAMGKCADMTTIGWLPNIGDEVEIVSGEGKGSVAPVLSLEDEDGIDFAWLKMGPGADDTMKKAVMHLRPAPRPTP